MSTESPTAALSALGVSIWLDDLSRERIASGGLQKLISERNVVGVTTNPTIFASALAKGEAYDAAVGALAKAGAAVTDAVFEITTDDVAAACDIFRPIYDATAGFDGRVSIEVEPGLAHDAAGTGAQAKQRWEKVDRQRMQQWQADWLSDLFTSPAMTSLRDVDPPVEFSGGNRAGQITSRLA